MIQFNIVNRDLDTFITFIKESYVFLTVHLFWILVDLDPRLDPGMFQRVIYHHTLKQ